MDLPGFCEVGRWCVISGKFENSANSPDKASPYQPRYLGAWRNDHWQVRMWKAVEGLGAKFLCNGFCVIETTE